MQVSSWFWILCRICIIDTSSKLVQMTVGCRLNQVVSHKTHQMSWFWTQKKEHHVSCFWQHHYGSFLSILFSSHYRVQRYDKGSSWAVLLLYSLSDLCGTSEGDTEIILPSFFFCVSSAVLGLVMLQSFIMQRGCVNGSSRAAGLIVVVTRHLRVYE